jgi:hypothetical protein
VTKASVVIVVSAPWGATFLTLDAVRTKTTNASVIIVVSAPWGATFLALYAVRTKVNTICSKVKDDKGQRRHCRLSFMRHHLFNTTVYAVRTKVYSLILYAVRSKTTKASVVIVISAQWGGHLFILCSKDKDDKGQRGHCHLGSMRRHLFNTICSKDKG